LLVFGVEAVEEEVHSGEHAFPEEVKQEGEDCSSLSKE